MLPHFGRRTVQLREFIFQLGSSIVDPRQFCADGLRIAAGIALASSAMPHRPGHNSHGDWAGERDHRGDRHPDRVRCDKPDRDPQPAESREHPDVKTSAEQLVHDIPAFSLKVS